MTDLPPGCGIVVVFLGKGERVPLSEPYYSLIFPVNQPLFYRFVKLCKRKFLSRKNVTFPISKNFFMLCKCHIFILELIFALFLCILHKKYTIYYSCFLIISSYFLYVHSGSLSWNVQVWVSFACFRQQHIFHIRDRETWFLSNHIQGCFHQDICTIWYSILTSASAVWFLLLHIRCRAWQRLI